MMPEIIIILAILVILSIEFCARVFYYFKIEGYTTKERIKMVFLGRWLISEESTSPLYLKKIASSLGIYENELVEILSCASGKDKQEISQLFLEKSGKQERYVFEPILGFLPAPRQDIIHLKTNKLGFRCRDVPERKPAYVKRVLLLGGSVAFGRTATSENATISRQLEKKLNKHLTDINTHSWEVINMAVPDFISIQELFLLIKTGIKFDPDIVISLSGINDAHHYINTGKLNEPSSFSSVKTAYNAYFGNPFQRFILFFGSYLISIYYFTLIVRSEKNSDEGELSPFIYTIW
jgi:hypothetical protein